MSNTQLTFKGDEMIIVLLRDKVTLEYLNKASVKRSWLAKAYHEQRVTHAIDGFPVIDV